MKVVNTRQMESYYERFCETVQMGLSGRVIDLDVVGEEHEMDDEEEDRAGYETEVGSEVNEYHYLRLLQKRYGTTIRIPHDNRALFSKGDPIIIHGKAAPGTI